jgi:Concanavalin A-like lectin/glucanases superfamily
MARDFPGTAGNYFDLGDVVDITGTALTVACWVRPDSTLNYDWWVSKEDGIANIQYALAGVGEIGGASTGTAQFRIGSPSVINAVATATSLGTGVWKHLAGVKNGSGAGALKIYLNGVQDGSVADTLVIGHLGTPLRFGTRGNDDIVQADGRLAEVGIWDAALSVAEILALAKGTSPGQVRPLSLKGYWPLFGFPTPELDRSSGKHVANLTGTVPQVAHAPVAPHYPFVG